MSRNIRVLTSLLCLPFTVACLCPISSSPPTHTPTPPPTPSRTRTPPSIPSYTPTPPPIPSYTPTPPPTRGPAPVSDHAPALRPEFTADLNLFPNAPRYEIELIVDIDVAYSLVTITGHQRVDYTNAEDVPLDVLYLRLFPNTPGYGGAMEVTSILLDGEVAAPTVELEGSALRLPLDPPLEPGARRELALDFTVVPASEAHGGYGQLMYDDGILALANVYPLIPVYDDEGWNVEVAPVYGDATYSDTAFYTVRITAPADVTLIASGTCTTPTPNPNGSETQTCVTGPMRDFNAVLGPDYQVNRQIVGGVTVNSWFYSGHRAGGEWALDCAAEALRLFSTRFGPYPFAELDVVETPTRAGGIEYPGLVVINDAYYEDPGKWMEWTTVHEVGHQWWYSLVGNDQVDEPWLDEALVQYSTLLYFEDRYGAGAAAELLEQRFERPRQDLIDAGRDAPVGLPVAAYSREDYAPVVYGKGPLYFHALRDAVGDERFGAVLQAYFTRNRYGIATPEDWLATVQAVTGDEHRRLYQRWIMGE
jgi:hypothetical protein